MRGALIIQKIATIGLTQAFRVITNRVKSTRYAHQVRSGALCGSAHHSWEVIAQKLSLQSFERFLDTNRLRSFAFIKSFYHENYDAFALPEQLKKIEEKRFEICGREMQFFSQINWHEGFEKEAHFFYKDIQIPIHTGQHIGRDIKIPWDLSRCHHFMILGMAFEKTHDLHHAHIFMEHMQSWIDANPYLLGVNWVCPMEVALRAINWIVAFEYFKKCPIIPVSFWQKFCESLYDHMIYLEHNWEYYDSRTSNHYLSDLVGYLYLCMFFKEGHGVAAKTKWVKKEILNELYKTVHSDGSNYEGSTHYHKLVTELFYHAYQLFLLDGDPLCDQIKKKLKGMYSFLDWCTPKGGNLISIGDNDSGKVLFGGLPQNSDDLEMPLRTSIEKTFTDFGLSIIKTDQVHCTLRRYAYHPAEPNGHRHHDLGSVTLAIDGIDIFVDPGSYLYTSSALWRNYFRSAAVHNTMWNRKAEPSLSNDLFFLDMYTPQILNRELLYNDDLNVIEIQDHINLFDPTQLYTWNFTFGSSIEVKKYDNNFWILEHKGKKIAELISPLLFELQETWVSPRYGIKEKSLSLRATAQFERCIIKLLLTK